MSDDFSTSFSFSKKWSQRINVLVGIVSLLAIVVMVNYLSARHYQRIHLRSTDRAQLSPLSKRLLAGLTNEVRIIAYFSREEALYGDVRELLREYKAASPKISLELLDPIRDPPAAQDLKARFKLAANEKAFVLFESQGKKKVIQQGELFDYDLQPLVSGTSKEVKRKDFKGELLFTSAIYSLTAQRPAKAYFLLLGPSAPSPRDRESVTGFAKFADLLRDSGVDWGVLDSTAQRLIPEDCSLLVIPGPRLRPSDGVLEAIQRYLENGGRAMVLFDVYGRARETGLEDILRRFGVKVGFDVVEDPMSISLDKKGQSVVVNEFGNHPITKGLASGGEHAATLHMILPRSIQPVSKSQGAADSAKVDVLFSTSAEGISRDGGSLIARGSDGASLGEVRTNISLAVAVERGGLPGVDAARAGASRIVVTGDSLFACNQTIDSAANWLFCAYSVNWLLDRSALLGEVGARPYREFHLSMTESDRNLLTWIFLAGFPGVALLLGFFVWLRRRS